MLSRMNQDLIPFIGWGAVGLAILIALIAYKKVLRLFGLFIVPEDSVAIVTKKFVLFGAHKTLPDGRIVALQGEAGIQADTLAPGLHWWLWPWQYATSLQRFVVLPEGTIGIVETMEGMPLSTGSGDIAGPVIEGHNSFQDAQAFVDHRGRKGLQEEVLLPGRYFINPKFASVEVVDMTIVPFAQVGVVISYVGSLGEDVTGAAFKHGNMVIKGQRGVWVDPLDPGKYPINHRTTKIELVPTANVVLNWATGKTEAHKLDERLSSITVRSQDGFTFNLDVSQIIHIPRNAAPKVIARFGSMANLVTQVLEPTIGNYFRNAG